MMIIADSGSTKTDWAICHGAGEVKYLTGVGLNPFFVSEDEVAAEVERVIGKGRASDEHTVFWFYGAGCSNELRKSIVRNGLKRIFPGASVHVHHDLLGAARALCRNDPGVACILGTGSNSCLYDGKEIIDNIKALGYVLGDEGSGADLGKALVRAYAYREMPTDIAESFTALTGGVESILEAVYNQPLANRYLASFAPFCSEWLAHPFMKKLVENRFACFVERHLLKYSSVTSLTVHFVGSVAFHFAEILTQVCNSRGLQTGTILKRPIDALIEYHNGEFHRPA
ncbi:MAG: ATPase [Salibacteraceae bacterium]